LTARGAGPETGSAGPETGAARPETGAVGPTDAARPEPGPIGWASPEPGPIGWASPEPGLTGSASPEPGLTGSASPEPGLTGSASPEPGLTGSASPEPGPTGATSSEAGAASRETDAAGPERLVSPLADIDDRAAESALRPKRLAEFIGQARVREQLSLVLEGALRRGRPPEHVLLAGPPGLGKTTMAMIIAAELGAPLRVTSGPAIERPGDLAAILSTLGEGEVVFIDEIHRVARPAEELLYLAMEDFRVDVVVGKGPGATAIPLEIAPFTLVGATTRAGLLPAPLRDRFGFTAHLDFYAAEELGVIVRRSARLLGVTLRDDGADEIAGRSRGTPRIANRLLRRVRDFAEVRGDGVVSRDAARIALELYEVDESGLDRIDRAVLTALVSRFGGGPVGVSTLAVAVGEEAETVEVVAEPFLVRAGLIARTPRGRVATAAAWRHLGLAPAPGSAGCGPGSAGYDGADTLFG
jgi:Holliday junction DNA helicase RuvB